MNGLTPEERFEILDVLARYNWAIDCDDPEAFASTFSADGEVVMPNKVFKGTDELQKMIVSLRERREAGGERNYFHAPQNVVLERIGPDRVRLVTQLVGPRITPEGTTVIKHGWYDDELVHTTDGWRFARRAFQPWPQKAPLGSSPVPFPATG